MQVSDLKENDILYILWGCKPNVKRSCVYFHIEPNPQAWPGCSIVSVEGYQKGRAWTEELERVFEDWGQLFLTSKFTSHSGTTQYFIERVNPCHGCKFRLGKLAGRCPGKFEPLEE